MSNARKPKAADGGLSAYNWIGGIESDHEGGWYLSGSPVPGFPGWHFSADVRRVPGGYVVRRIEVAAVDAPEEAGITARLMQQISPDKIVRSLAAVSREPGKRRLGNLVEEIDGRQAVRDARRGAARIPGRAGYEIEWWAELARRYATASQQHRNPAVVLAEEDGVSPTKWHDRRKKCVDKGLLRRPTAPGIASCEITDYCRQILAKGKHK